MVTVMVWGLVVEDARAQQAVVNSVSLYWQIFMIQLINIRLGLVHGGGRL